MDVPHGLPTKFPTSDGDVLGECRRPIPAIDIKIRLGQLKKSPTTGRITSRLTEASTLSEEVAVTKPDVPVPMNKISSYIATGSQTGSFAGTSLAILVFLIAPTAVWLLFRCTRASFTKKTNETRKRKKKKKNGKYDRVSDTEQPKTSNEETSDDDSNEDFLKAMNSYDPLTIANLKSTTLSELPPDLEDLLVKKLDVPCKGRGRYGWQKVGAAFKIPSDVLKYLKIEYKRENGSPTSELLSILGKSYGKTVSGLVDVLKSLK